MLLFEPHILAPVHHYGPHLPENSCVHKMATYLWAFAYPIDYHGKFNFDQENAEMRTQ